MVGLSTLPSALILSSRVPVKEGICPYCMIGLNFSNFYPGMRPLWAFPWYHRDLLWEHEFMSFLWTHPRNMGLMKCLYLFKTSPASSGIKRLKNLEAYHPKMASLYCIYTLFFMNMGIIINMDRFWDSINYDWYNDLFVYPFYARASIYDANELRNSKIQKCVLNSTQTQAAVAAAPPVSRHGYSIFIIHTPLLKLLKHI